MKSHSFKFNIVFVTFSVKYDVFRMTMNIQVRCIKSFLPDNDGTHHLTLYIDLVGACSNSNVLLAPLFLMLLLTWLLTRRLHYSTVTAYCTADSHKYDNNVLDITGSRSDNI